MNEVTDILDGRRKKRRWHQFSLRTLLLATFCVAVLIAASVALWREHADPLRHARRFHGTISSADRIVVRGQDFSDRCSKEEVDILFEVTDEAKVAEVREHLQFLAQTAFPRRFCGDYPEIDWYRGDERLACMRLRQYDRSLEWIESNGIAMLTPESWQWIVQWLAKNDVSVTMPQGRAAGEETARQQIRARMPAGFWEAVSEADAKTAEQLRGWDLPMSESAESLKDRYVGQLCKDRPLLYRSLFRMMGDRHSSWEPVVECPELVEAFRFLTRAPRDELDRAFRSAAESPDRFERRGAARMVFTQHFMPRYGKTEDDLVRWMSELVDTACSIEDCGNRQLVLSRLIEYPQVRASDVLAQAIEDPNAQVRRLAIDALRVRGGADAAALLRRVAAGQTIPRKATTFAERFRTFAERFRVEQAMEEGQDADTDAQAAKKALQAMTQ